MSERVRAPRRSTMRTHPTLPDPLALDLCSLCPTVSVSRLLAVPLSITSRTFFHPFWRPGILQDAVLSFPCSEAHCTVFLRRSGALL
jgi:hypothetical protein